MQNHIDIFNTIFSVKDKLTENEYLLLNNDAQKLLKLIDKQNEEIKKLTSIITTTNDTISIIEYENLKISPCSCIDNFSLCLNADCNNFKLLCDINPNFKYIHSITMENNTCINKDINNIQFIDYKIYHNNYLDKHTCMFLSLCRRFIDPINNEKIKIHVKCFITFVMYDSFLRNFEYINFIKYKHKALYIETINKFNQNKLFFDKRCIEIANYYNIDLLKWKEIFN